MKLFSIVLFASLALVCLWVQPGFAAADSVTTAGKTVRSAGTCKCGVACSCRDGDGCDCGISGKGLVLAQIAKAQAQVQLQPVPVSPATPPIAAPAPGNGGTTIIVAPRPIFRIGVDVGVAPMAVSTAPPTVIIRGGGCPGGVCSVVIVRRGWLRR